MKSKIFVILGLIFVLTACGQTGNLYLPKEQKAELKARQAARAAKQKAMLQAQNQKEQPQTQQNQPVPVSS